MKNFNHLIVEIEALLQTRKPEQKGDETAFICPSHNDSKPSARWHHAKRVWYCDACGDGGGAVDLGKKLGVKRS
jgi:hypothetical protein